MCLLVLRVLHVSMLIAVLTINLLAGSAFAQPADGRSRPRNKILRQAWREHCEENYDEAIRLYEEVLKDEPENEYANCSVADLYLHFGRLDRLATVVEHVLKAKPKFPKTHALHAAVLLHKRDYDNAIEAWNTALKLDPVDSAIDLEIDLESPEPSGMEEARKQLQSMAKDLPGLLDNVDEQDPLYQWTLRRLAGQGLVSPVSWDSKEPERADAEHLPPRRGNPGFIRVSRTRRQSRPIGEPVSVDRYWACIVFELFNIANTKDFADLLTDVKNGKIRRQFFVRKCVNLEQRASRYTRAFYSKVYLPHCKEKKIETNVSNWFGSSWQPPYENLESFGDDELDYPWIVFGLRYDHQVLGALKKEHSWDEALAAIDRMLLHSHWLGPEREYWTLVNKGYVLDCQGKLQSAIQAYSEALSINPTDYVGLINRAEAYMKDGQIKKAIEDAKSVQQQRPKDTYSMSILKRAHLILSLMPTDPDQRQSIPRNSLQKDRIELGMAADAWARSDRLKNGN